jgi:hypothetical protein
MASEHIPPAFWREFLTSFSRMHAGWLVDVDFQPATDPRLTLMHQVPLVGIADDDGRIVITAGLNRQHVDHVVERPVSVRREHTPEGVDVGLDIDSEGGESVRVRFRSAMRPELVDGI